MAAFETRMLVLPRGGGGSVQVVSDRQVRNFVIEVYRDIILGEVGYFDFSLGFCAALEALAAGRVDFGFPADSVGLAWDRVNDFYVHDGRESDAWTTFLEEIGGWR